MENEAGIDKDAYVNTQANISIILVIAIILMGGVYMGCTESSENERLYWGAFIPLFITILLGIYTFSYPGKAHLTSRVIFFIFLVISVLSILFLCYIIGLGRAFQH